MHVLLTSPLRGLRLLCVVSLLLVAFAHKPITLGPIVSDIDGPYSIAYLLPDGTFPVICITDVADPQKNHLPVHQLHVSDCDACRISSAFICPAPLPSNGAAFQVATVAIAEPSTPAISRVAYPPSAPPQAPPLA